MSVKTAVPDYPIHELLRERWSPRAFSEQSLEPERLRSLFEAARWAASCNNEQPWNFSVARKEDSEAFERLAGCLSPGNAWAKKAAALGLSVATLNFNKSQRPNPHAWHDVGLAMGNLWVQATSMGIYLHQMAGFDPAKAREVLTIPESHAPVAMMALGYLGEPSVLSEELQKREFAPRQRKPQTQFVFGGHWGEPASL